MCAAGRRHHSVSGNRFLRVTRRVFLVEGGLPYRSLEWNEGVIRKLSFHGAHSPGQESEDFLHPVCLMSLGCSEIQGFQPVLVER